MRINQSAGILLYRKKGTGIEVLLVHPGGPFHVKRDLGAWSIPKGEFDENEESLAAAKREFEEELGQKLKAEKFLELKPVKQKSGKKVFAWAAEGDLDVTTVKSNIFKLEYPYKSGKWIDVPEVDRAEWFTTEVAKQKINPGQVGLIDELISILL
jgi:predicted NUDIX family NTP pyrophosphohydrolase